MFKEIRRTGHSCITDMFLFLLVSLSAFIFSITGCSCSDSNKSDNRPNGPINVSVSTSRITGVAPLSVFFDATGTTGLGVSNESFFSDNANYMDATFAWNFDADNIDPDGKYEKGSGFVAAHVFEHPGTYRVHLDVYDATGETASTDINITVRDFTGITYYVAANGSDDNDGSIEHPFATPAHALSSSILGPNVRVLFRNGDTFTITRQITISDKTGPIIIGGYSDPSNPSTAHPIIYTTASNSDWATIYFNV